MKFQWIFISLFLLGIFFRTSYLLQSPPALYWEEIALGYDSYSILQTGKDHHGNPFPIIAFESFGDWKPSLYFYYLVPFIAVFGLSDLAIRLGAVTVGIVFMAGIPFLAKELRINTRLALLVTAISPWAVHFSRAAWESYLAATLIVWAVIFGLRAKRSKRGKALLISSALFGLSLYAYHAARIISPLLFGTILFLSLPIHLPMIKPKIIFKYLSQSYLQYVAPVLLFIIMLLPLLLAIVRQDVSITHRFQETNIFSDISVIERSNNLKEMSGNSVLSRLLYHRYVLFGEEIVKNVFSYFTLDYLILNGDMNLRHSTGFTGVIYPLELLFLLIGAVSLIKKSIRISLLLFVWLALTLLPASITTPNPHALRTLVALPVFIVWITEGIMVSTRYVIRQVLQLHSSLGFIKISLVMLRKVVTGGVVSVIAGLYVFSVTGFWQYYLNVYPLRSQHDWQYGYSQMITSLAEVDSQTPVFISREYGRPAMYYWFYTETDPRLVQDENAFAAKDQAEFLTYKNVTFYRSLSEILPVSGAIIAMPSTQKTEMASKLAEAGFSFTEQSTVSDLNGSSIWSIVEVQK